MSEFDSAYHAPVLLAECLDALNAGPGKTLLDATLGGGGHSEALLQAITPGGTLIALDRDPDALTEAVQRLQSFTPQNRIILLHTPFGKMQDALTEWEQQDTARPRIAPDGILFDLGVSSHQLDTARGFSFRRDEPLNMRMDTTSGISAADLLASESERELTRILGEWGEERWAARIAKRIVETRQTVGPLQTTGQLAALVEQSIPRAAWPRDIHPATRTFQGLRIAVNDELGQLKAGLEQAIARLAPAGRLAAISYHSLEDRIVKQTLAEHAGQSPGAPGSSPAAFLPPTRTPDLTLLTRKPITPTPGEIARNPRARSAKLRVAERL